ncbi:MAG: hypothetical protein ACI976_002110 [Aureispira sp.]|jgi:hypothetical protein
MKRIKTLLVFSFFTTFLSLIVISCTNDKTPDTVKVDSSSTPTLSLGTRTVKKNIAAKSYYYKNLVTFEKGATTFELEDWANLINKKISLIVLYEAHAPWAEVFKPGKLEITGNDQMNGLMESYNLEIIKQFAINDSNEGIVMVPKSILENPIETARKISMVDHVLMVHIKEVPTPTNIATSGTEK